MIKETMVCDYCHDQIMRDGDSWLATKLDIRTLAHPAVPGRRAYDLTLHLCLGCTDKLMKRMGWQHR